MSYKQQPADQDLDNALREILLAPRGKVRNENRTPTREELSESYVLERKEKKSEIVG